MARYYADKGYVCAGIDYRLLKDRGQVPGYGLSELTEDCIDAVRYLKDREKDLALDFSRSAVLGESAGGYLAAMVVTMSHRLNLGIGAGIFVNSILDTSDEYWGEYVPKNVADKKEFSPTLNIDEFTPPVLLIHGTSDEIVSPKHSQVFYDRMAAYNRQAELHWIKDTNHAFLLVEFMKRNCQPLSAAETGIKITDKFLGV